jgi:hypothetical protein
MPERSSTSTARVFGFAGGGAATFRTGLGGAFFATLGAAFFADFFAGFLAAMGFAFFFAIRLYPTAATLELVPA